jgi:proliferating cell nuclear antigen
MLNLFKLVRTLTNNDALSLFIDVDNTNLLGIRIENGEKNSITTYYLNLIEVDETTYQIPPAQFESIITMPSNDFNKICRDMINISDIIEIKSVGNQLIFSCKGEFAQQETIIGEANNGLSFVKSSVDNNIIQGYYNLKHLVLFTKCSNLCNSIEIYMKNNFPIVIKFAVGSIGNLTLALAPKVEMD